MPDRPAQERPLAAVQRQRRPQRVERRLGDDMQHAVRRIGAVQRRRRAEEDFDALHVLVGPRHEERDVDPKRRHAGEPVVLQHEDRAGERVVEAARHHVALGDAPLVHVHTGNAADVIRDRHRRALLDVPDIDDRHGRRRIERLLRSPRGRRHHRIQFGRDFIEREVDGRVAARGHVHPVRALELVSEPSRHHGVDAGGDVRDAVAPVVAGEDRRGDLAVAGERLYARAADRTARRRDGPGDRTPLRERGMSRQRDATQQGNPTNP